MRAGAPAPRASEDERGVRREGHLKSQDSVTADDDPGSGTVAGLFWGSVSENARITSSGRGKFRPGGLQNKNVHRLARTQLGAPANQSSGKGRKQTALAARGTQTARGHRRRFALIGRAVSARRQRRGTAHLKGGNMGRPQPKRSEGKGTRLPAGRTRERRRSRDAKKKPVRPPRSRPDRRWLEREKNTLERRRTHLLGGSLPLAPSRAAFAAVPKGASPPPRVK